MVVILSVSNALFIYRYSISRRLPSQLFCIFFFQAEDGIRDLVRSRGLGDVYNRQRPDFALQTAGAGDIAALHRDQHPPGNAGMRSNHSLSLIHI